MDSLFPIDEEPKPEPTGERLPVLLPIALDQAYDYLCPPELKIRPGTFVVVPFGRQQRIGVVWHSRNKNDAKSIDASKLKSIISAVDVPRLSMETLKFIDWIASYTLAERGMTLKMFMSAKQIFDGEKPRIGVTMAGPAPKRMTEARSRVIEQIKDGEIWPKGSLAEKAGVSPAVITGLVKSGTLIEAAIPSEHPPVPVHDFGKTEFSELQLQAVHSMKSLVDANNYSTTLLDGITGSGKTEVYFEAVAHALKKDKQVLILLPEISLTGQFLSRFKSRFGCMPIEWHSAVSAGDRAKIWKDVATGMARAIVGARSALFLPFDDLGLIVVDEEHDVSFKQEDRVIYHARDMAVVRASIGNLPIILASATPSIESQVNAREGRYRYVQLTERFGGAVLPTISSIDIRKDKSPPPQGKWLSPILVEAMMETLAKEQQSLLFLNRRGYAPLTLCRSCGHRFNCPQCAAWLVEHRFRHRLACHHCGFSTPSPKICPTCSDEDSLIPCGPGVERIAEEVKEYFPDANLAILSSDLITNIHDMRSIISSIEKGEADIIIGTQIVAKGHNFPNLALVGVVDGDLGLGQADPRAAERTFQLLYQVTGRAGRAWTDGRGLIQTHMPEHPVMKSMIAADRDAFLETEIEARRYAEMPPYGRLAAIIISSRSRDIAAEYARTVSLRAPESDKVRVLGPSEAPIAIVRNRYRYRILIKAAKEIDLSNYMRTWRGNIPKTTGDLRMAIDIDPYNFL